MSDLGLTLRQVGYTNRSFWRNPASAFFTFVFPLMFLVIFASLFGSGVVHLPSGGTLDQSTYYVAAMAAFGVLTACYTNLAMGVTIQRDGGILKRTRGTPLPGWSYLTARVLHAMLMASLLVIISAVFGRLAYGATLPTGMNLARTVLVVAVGAVSFSALALALTAAIPNADAAPAIVNATILPLLFVSGVFVPLTKDAPQWIITLGDIFPVKHFVDAFLGSFYGPPNFAFDWKDVAIVAAWGIGGLLLAARYFSWEPRK